jgi:PEP-CTERM motif
MRYPVLLAAALLALVSPAHAEPIPTYHVTDAAMFMLPNLGAGEHISFALTGPGVDIRGEAGMACFEWCSGAPIVPGTVIGLSQIFTDGFNMALVGGVTYDPFSEIGILSPSLFNDSGGLNPIATGFVGSGPTFTDFRLTLPTNGNWNLNFVSTTDENGNSTVAFVNGRFSASAPVPTPEPGTFGLMLAGSAGIAWIRKRRRT